MQTSQSSDTDPTLATAEGIQKSKYFKNWHFEIYTSYYLYNRLILILISSIV